MMTIQDLIEKLKERPGPQTGEIDQAKREWLAALEQLFTTIEDWLADAVNAGVLTTSRSFVDVQEHDLGFYEAPVLEITDRRLTVRFEPVGRAVVTLFAGGARHEGLRGSVNLVCGPVKIPIGRTRAGTWKVLPLRGAPRDLTAETLSEILAEVLLDE